MTNEEIMAVLRSNTLLNQARVILSSHCGRVEQDQDQRKPAGPLEVRRWEFEATKKIGEVLNGRTVTLDQAKRIVDNQSNGALYGTSPSKGGRAWLEGEWCLAELEALCIMLRHEAGDNAEGAAELQAIWDEQEAME